MSPYEPPTPAQLEAKALNYIKDCKPKSYREMGKAGTLQDFLTLSTEGAKRYAENLIHGGMWAEEAMNRAIRQEILESESD